VHGNSKLGVVWEVFSANFQVASLHENVTSIKSLVIVMIILVRLKDKGAVDEDELKLWHFLHIDKQVLARWDFNSFSLEGWNVIAPCLFVAPS